LWVRLEKCDREIERFTAMLKDPEMESSRQILEMEIFYEKQLRDRIANLIGAPRKNRVAKTNDRNC
ncbi:MAG: hypothetical protein JO068_07940, partial [Hyphomicrobiales bacterium]|nr:hypothetical protein [Hyphomicrobiales bacterium]